MALSLDPDPGPGPGQESPVRLHGSSAAQPHGSVTAELLGLLDGPGRPPSTVGELGQLIRGRFGRQVTVGIAEEIAVRPVLDDPGRARAVELVTELENRGLREVVAVLERQIAIREGQDDLWPEGRLNAGIALAELGEHALARVWLQEAVDVLSGRGLRRHDTVTAL